MVNDSFIVRTEERHKIIIRKETSSRWHMDGKSNGSWERATGFNDINRKSIETTWWYQSSQGIFHMSKCQFATRKERFGIQEEQLGFGKSIWIRKGRLGFRRDLGKTDVTTMRSGDRNRKSFHKASN